MFSHGQKEAGCLTDAENGINVFLVDDDKDVCKIIQSGLERYGFHVTAFTDPSEAMSHYMPKRYGKVVLDVRMPGIIGFHMAKKIWSMDPEARICFFSAFDMSEKEARMVFKDFRGVDFIKKPIVPAELAVRITESMQNH